MIAIDPKSRSEWTPPFERELPKDKQTVFLLRPLTAAEKAEVMELALRVEQVAAGAKGEIAAVPNRPSLAQERAARLALTGWRNVTDARGVPLAFPLPTDIVPGIDYLDWATIATMGSHVMAAMSVSGEALAK